MKNKNMSSSTCLFLLLLGSSILPFIIGKLDHTEFRVLNRLRRVLEYPQILQTWSRRSDFCSITASDSVFILCSGNHISELSLTGTAKSKSLSQSFSIDSLFATVTKLSNLTKLSLVSLGIWGTLPDNIGPSSLQLLNLSSNYISSTIPDLTRMKHLQGLDISKNKLIGHIPSSLFSLHSIQYLDLGGNELTGALSSNTSCNGQLQFVDISNNLLFGEVPPCLRSIRTVMCSWNCFSTANLTIHQHPNVFCHREALAVKPADSTKKHSRFKAQIVIGIVIGVVGIIMISGAMFIIINIKSKKTRKLENLTVKSSPNFVFGSNAIEHLPRTMRSGTLGLPSYQIFAFEQIEDATSNFDPSNLIGNDDHHSQLCKGWLGDGMPITVKCMRFDQRNFLSSQSLLQYVDSISKLGHQNLISVIGHCIVIDNQQGGCSFFIVLEDTAKDSLRDYLADRMKKELLKWPQRITMVIGIARGVHFLHNEISPGIFGNNLKLQNILLDENLMPKITNYRFPSPWKITAESNFNGENADDHANTSVNAEEKRDVYQLGIILLETLTGREIRSQTEINHQKHQMEKALLEAPTAIGDAVDSSLRGTYAYKSLRTAVEMTVNCLNDDPSKRPTMEDILWNLRYSFQVQEAWSMSQRLALNPSDTPL